MSSHYREPVYCPTCNDSPLVGYCSNCKLNQDRCLTEQRWGRLCDLKDEYSRCRVCDKKARFNGETVEAAAIRYEGEIYTIPRPARHHDITFLMSELGLGPDTMRDQGFVTSTGRFVDRKEACEIAKAAKQIKVKTGPSHVLFSEDVW